MANQAINMYALSLEQIATAIKVGGKHSTVLVQGDMGTGKSSLLKTLAKELPNHLPVYFDCTTKDLGDIAIPQLQAMDDEGCVRFVPNEELGIHLRKPVILMIDEYGKANPAVKNALLRVMLERELAGYKFHEDSLMFATTNKGSEGVGDILPPHARNRITIVQSRKPDFMEWIEWGINNGIDHTLLGWVKDNPSVMASFEDVANPDDNPYIFHPKAQRNSFVTPRSLERASNWLKQRDMFDSTTLTAMLMGTVGERAAMDLMAFVALADQLPTLDSIKRDPMNAVVPTSDAAVCMIVYRSLANIERDWVDAWMDYMGRLDTEAQGLFVNGVRTPKYNKQSMIMTNKKFRDWALKNNYLFAADVK